MTTLQVNLYMQRNQEPVIKRQTDDAIAKARHDEKHGSKVTHGRR